MQFRLRENRVLSVTLLSRAVNQSRIGGDARDDLETALPGILEIHQQGIPRENARAYARHSAMLARGIDFHELSEELTVNKVVSYDRGVKSTVWQPDRAKKVTLSVMMAGRGLSVQGIGGLFGEPKGLNEYEAACFAFGRALEEPYRAAVQRIDGQLTLTCLRRGVPGIRVDLECLNGFHLSRADWLCSPASERPALYADLISPLAILMLAILSKANLSSALNPRASMFPEICMLRDSPTMAELCLAYDQYRAHVTEFIDEPQVFTPGSGNAFAPRFN
ncbi:MAG: hypothetical protein U0136_21910 [Bdellovibrionota bacterium]